MFCLPKFYFLLIVENRVRPLALVVKKWASFHGINDASRGTLNSYSLVLMVLHYLQSKYSLNFSNDFCPEYNACQILFLESVVKKLLAMSLGKIFAFAFTTFTCAMFLMHERCALGNMHIYEKY